MRASVSGPVLFLTTFLLAACGGGEGATITLRGSFASEDGDPPTRVLAVEAQREAEVAAGAFELPQLTAGPVTLLVLSGPDTLATMAVGNLPAGAEVALGGIRVDPESRRAFPTTLDGAELLMVNGLRMGPADRLPSRVDAPGTVLAVSESFDVLLLRPDDAAMPDLRVVVSPATTVATPDGDPVRVEAIAVGDSVRVRGESGRGLVLADTLTVPRSMALERVSAADAGGSGDDSDGDGGSGEDAGSGGRSDGGGSGGGGGDGDSGGGSVPRAVAPAPVIRVPVAAVRPGRGKDDRPRGRGRENGRGGGNGNGKGKKN